MHLLVTGGNGFIGRRVCARAIADGHDVTSISRSGPPESASDSDWSDDVHWVSADIFSPDEWRAALDGADCVVHSIGIIAEDPAAGVTFERVNGDSAILAALEAERANVDRFVSISSSNRPPLVPEAYITARRRAERTIADLNMEIVVPRFGPVYGPDQPHFPAIVNRLFAALGRFETVARRFDEDRPFAVEQAAEATYHLATMADPPESPVTAETLASLG